MKNIIIIMLFTAYAAVSQVQPETYKLDNGKSLNKTIDKTPKSNSITDILVENNRIWLSTTQGLSMSDDDGETWNNYYDDPAFGNYSVSALGYNNGKIWVALAENIESNGETLPAGRGLRYSSDNGISWTKVDQPVDNAGDSLLTYGNNQVRALPITTAINNLIYDIAFLGDTLFIASFAGGLRKSGDNGATWERIILPPDYLNEISPDDTINFSLQPVGGNFGSESYLNHRLFSVVSVNDSTIFAGTADGINKSTDYGVSWQKYNNQNQDSSISGNFVTALAYNEPENSLWAATWRAEGITEFYGVSVSKNLGKSWATYLPEEKAHNFGFYNYDPGSGLVTEVVVPTDNAAYRTNNGGISWVAPTAIRDESTGFLLTSSVFYSAGFSNTSIDPHSTWLGTTDGLVKLEEFQGDMWEGNWKIYQAAVPLEDESDTYAYPNPFSPDLGNVKILYTAGNSSQNISIRIFDFSMNLVRVLIQNVDRSGSGDFIEIWDGRDEEGELVANGVYFYRIDYGSGKSIFNKILVAR